MVIYNTIINYHTVLKGIRSQTIIIEEICDSILNGQLTCLFDVGKCLSKEFAKL